MARPSLAPVFSALFTLGSMVVLSVGSSALLIHLPLRPPSTVPSGGTGGEHRGLKVRQQAADGRPSLLQRARVVDVETGHPALVLEGRLERLPAFHFPVVPAARAQPLPPDLAVGV